MNYRERFFNVMEHRPVDQVPNREAGVWPRTRRRWGREGLGPNAFFIERKQDHLTGRF